MNVKQDRQGVRRASDLEQKYSFGSVFKNQDSKNKEQSERLDAQNMSMTQFKSFATNKLDALQASLTALDGELDSLDNQIISINDAISDLRSNISSLGSTVAEAKTYTNTQVKKAAPRNLLDNSDFRNPVNQRGSTTYTKSAWGGYTIDRWAAYASNCTVTILEDGVNLSGSIYQPIGSEIAKKYDGKTVTMAAKINGDVYCAHGQVSLTGNYSAAVHLDTPYGYIRVTCETTKAMFFVLNNTTAAAVEWAALIEGEYTTETLPEYQPKGYGAELAECQRYYYQLPYNNTVLLGTSGSGDGVGARINIPLPVTMRVNPSVGAFVVNVGYYGGTANGLTYTPSSAVAIPNGISLYGSLSTAISSSPTYVNCSYQIRNADLAISADL